MVSTPPRASNASCCHTEVTLCRARELLGPRPGVVGSAASGIAGQHQAACPTARESMNWVTVRLIMRIAHGVAAAATAVGLKQFSWRPGGARAGLAREARLGQGLLPRARAASPADQPLTGLACALRAAGSPPEVLRAGPRHPQARPCAPRFLRRQNTHC